MSGRRRMPEPAIPTDPNVHAPHQERPPQQYGVNPPQQVVTSPGPTEVPLPPLSPEEEQGRPVAPALMDGELSPEEQVNFASLLTCGRRTKTLHLLDHTVVVQTLCGADDLRIGVYAKPYAGTVGEQRAYKIAVAAAGIVSIDGKPLVSSLYQNADEAAMFDQKVKSVEKMYPAVITSVYKAVLAAEQEFMELVDRLGKSFG